MADTKLSLQDLKQDSLRPIPKTNGTSLGLENHIPTGFGEWYEIKMTGKLPERRSYQISQIWNDYVYIFGGQDLKEGCYNTLWRLDLKAILEGQSVSWEQVHTQNVPARISHHSGFIHNDKFYVFGGLQGIDSNSNMYCLDLNLNKWSSIERSAQWPPARDDHSGCFDEENGCMYMFGGYVNGTKSNDLWKFDANTQIWTKLEAGGPHILKRQVQPIRPCSRVGSSIVHYNNTLYLFGGHDENNEKISEFWKFDLQTNQWEKIEQQGAIPHGRNGHTMEVHNGKFIMFGGILEITKESDEVCIFDIESGTWAILENSAVNESGFMSPFGNQQVNDSLLEEVSIFKKDGGSTSNMKKSKNTQSQPNLQTIKEFSSSKIIKNEMNSTMSNQRRGSQSPLTKKQTQNNIQDQQYMKFMRGQETLSSPTSVTMKNAFILKNTNSSFENYYQIMKKRRNPAANRTMTLSTSNLDATIKGCLNINRNKPSARDGHSCFIFKNKMFIFGGDRHHMPFNDLFFLELH